MAKILIVTTGLTGILHASFEMTRRLTEAGHTVKLAAPRPVGDRVGEQGYAFAELPEIAVDPASILPSSKSRLGRMWLRFRDRKARRAAALEAYRPAAFERLLSEFDPGLTLIDIELHEYIFAAYGAGRNFALLSQWYSTWRRPGLPYLLTETTPGEGAEGSPEAIGAYWDSVKAQRRRMFDKMARLSFGTDRRSVLLALADEYGFPRRLIGENWWPGVFTYAELPAISMSPLEMEFPHDPRPGLTYVGPMVHTNRKEATATSQRGKKLEELLGSAKQAGRRVIVVTVSTLLSGDAGFLKNLIEAVRRRPDWTVVLALGGNLSAGSFGNLPDNVHVFSWLPQLQALAAADLSINHAGIHTIHECIHFGVPQLVYSGKRSDQPGCAARVHYHGIGRKKDKDTATPEDIRTAIEEVLSNLAYRERTGAMRSACAAYAEQGILERTVLQLLQPTKQTTPDGNRTL